MIRDSKGGWSCVKGNTPDQWVVLQQLKVVGIDCCLVHVGCPPLNYPTRFLFCNPWCWFYPWWDALTLMKFDWVTTNSPTPPYCSEMQSWSYLPTFEFATLSCDCACIKLSNDVCGFPLVVFWLLETVAGTRIAKLHAKACVKLCLFGFLFGSASRLCCCDWPTNMMELLWPNCKMWCKM